MRNQGLIELRKTSCHSHIELDFMEVIFGEVNTPEFDESYKIRVLDKFDTYIEENKSKINPNLEDKSKTLIWISYSDSGREILLNDIFLLSKPHFNGTNDRVFSYLYKNPNRTVSRDELIKEAKVQIGSKRLHDIIKELGFKKDLGKAFFSITKNSIKFNNPVNKQTLDELGINHIKIT